MKNVEPEKQDLIIGRNAVAEALQSGREIDTVFLLRGEKNPALTRLAAICREKGGVVKEVDRKKLDAMCAGGNHQGVAAFVAAHTYSTVEDILDFAREKGDPPFVVVCD